MWGAAPRTARFSALAAAAAAFALTVVGTAGAVDHADLITGADAGGGPHVEAFDGNNGTMLRSFLAYGATFSGGVRVAVGDVNGDGKADIVTGAGAGGSPRVKVFDGATGAQLQSFLAYGSTFTGGVFVAAGDVNGDGKADIVTGAGQGGGPHVEVFDGATGALIRSFFAYGPTFTGGVRVAAGDITGDGKADVITGAGPGGNPRVSVFDGATSAPVRSFLAYAATFNSGVYVGAGDVNGDGVADIVTGAGPGGGPHVEVFDGKTGSLVRSFFAYAPTFAGGVRVAAGDVTGDGKADVVTGNGPGAASQVEVFNGATGALTRSFVTYASGFLGGLFVASGDINPGADSIAPSAPTNLRVASKSSTSISLAWDASSDDVGVVGYGVYRNGVLQGSTAQTSFTFSGLGCGSGYTLAVDAYDAAGNRSAKTSLTASTSACPTPHALPYRYIFAPPAAADATVTADGWNLVDVGGKWDADQLPAGSKGLVWVGDYDNSSCSWQISDASLTASVQSMVGDPHVFGYFFSDEPYAENCPNAPAQHAARNALIKSIDPTTTTVILLNANGSSHRATWPLWSTPTDADYIAINPYPCLQNQACDWPLVTTSIQAADNAGFRYWIAAQSFADFEYRYPTSSELQYLLNLIAQSHAQGIMTFAWTYAGTCLCDHPDLLTTWSTYNHS